MFLSERQQPIRGDVKAILYEPGSQTTIDDVLGARIGDANACKNENEVVAYDRLTPSNDN
jgi:hypothetical protein